MDIRLFDMDRHHLGRNFVRALVLEEGAVAGVEEVVVEGSCCLSRTSYRQKHWNLIVQVMGVVAQILERFVAVEGWAVDGLAEAESEEGLYSQVLVLIERFLLRKPPSFFDGSFPTRGRPVLFAAFRLFVAKISHQSHLCAFE